MNLNKSRSDIFEQENLEKVFDINHVSYGDYLVLLRDFIKNELVCEEVFSALIIGDATQKKSIKYLHALEDFINSKIDVKTLKCYRTDAWQAYEDSKNNDKNLIRILVIGLYDEQSASYSVEDVSPHFEIIFTTLFDLAENFCIKFRFFLEGHSLMKKYQK